MTAYLFSIIGASLVAALIGILSPEGEGGGIAKHLRLLTALFLLCTLIAPLKNAMQMLAELADREWKLPQTDSSDSADYHDRLEEALENASTSYFTQMLTQALENTFSIETGQVRCNIQWSQKDDQWKPNRVTVILSGAAIWKDPEKLESFVRELLGCECVTAIE